MSRPGGYRQERHTPRYKQQIRPSSTQRSLYDTEHLFVFMTYSVMNRIYTEGQFVWEPGIWPSICPMRQKGTCDGQLSYTLCADDPL